MQRGSQGEGIMIRRLIPYRLWVALRWVYRFCRWVYYSSLDVYDSLTRRRDELTPPRQMLYAGYGDFKATGEEFLEYFIKLSDLKSDERVLDVGCGFGRMAIPLAKYLNEKGNYEGIDITNKGIKWCQKNISLQYSNFHFQLVDVFNKYYNPSGKYKAFEYKLPYQDKSFDFVFLTSVFTHMLPRDIENYFSEVARVLRRGGRCLITFFLLNKESLGLIGIGSSTLDFCYVFKDYRTINADVPENAVAYDEKYIRRLYDQYGLDIKSPIHYGSWSGRKNFLSYQDIIIASK